jgi:hypothetical protein
MSEETYLTVETYHDVEDNESDSCAVLWISGTVKYRGIRNHESHRKPTSSDSGYCCEEAEHDADKNRRPYPEFPDPSLTIMILDVCPYIDEKYDI